jgi:hypothetical protein
VAAKLRQTAVTRVAGSQPNFGPSFPDRATLSPLPATNTLQAALRRRRGLSAAWLVVLAIPFLFLLFASVGPICRPARRQPFQLVMTCTRSPSLACANYGKVLAQLFKGFAHFPLGLAYGAGEFQCLVEAEVFDRSHQFIHSLMADRFFDGPPHGVVLGFL